MAYRNGGIIDGCLALHNYATPPYSVNQNSVTVNGVFKPRIIYEVDKIEYIVDWIWETDKKRVIDQIYYTDTLESRLDSGYFLYGEPKWEKVTSNNGLKLWILYLEFRKGE